MPARLCRLCLLEKCERRAIAVSDALSIIGCDGMARPSAASRRAASIHVDFDLLTQTAIQLLIAQTHHPDQQVTQTRLAVTLDDGMTLVPPRSA